jgi:hypothetical protein
MDIIDNLKSFGVVVILALNRKLLYKLQYFHQRGRFPNLNHPRDLSEQILSEMLKPSFAARYADYADKIKVREYVRNKGLGDILLKHFGAWDDANKIDFNELPDKFVLKTNNGCGEHIFCRDKSVFDRQKSIELLNKTLHLPYIFNKEPQYKAINPLIFCEELIETGTEELPTDYKFTCIKGKPFDIFVATERRKKTKYCTFDMDWNLLDYTKREYFPKKLPEKPKNLNSMIEIAKTLSQNFDFVRVDLYDTGDKVWFGELTFTPWGGLMRSYTDEAINLMGGLLAK